MTLLQPDQCLTGQQDRTRHHIGSKISNIFKDQIFGQSHGANVLKYQWEVTQKNNWYQLSVKDVKAAFSLHGVPCSALP